MSQENGAKKETKGFVFYPRSFHVVPGDHLQSYAYGMSEGGRECIAYIYPEQDHLDRAAKSSAVRIPKFEDFEDSEPPLEAYSDNGPDNPRSMLLLEQAAPLENPPIPHQHPVMVAKWASIIKLNDRAIKPPLGYGFMDITVISGSNEETQALTESLKLIQAKINAKEGDVLELEQQRDIKAARLYEIAPCYFGLVMMNYKAITPVADAEQLRQVLEKVYAKYNADGRFAMALIRVRDQNNVYLNQCSHYEVRYSRDAGGPETFQESFDRFMKYEGRRSLKPGDGSTVIEVIPCQKINCGPNGKDLYKKDMARGMSSKTMKTFVQSEYYCQPHINLRRETAFLYSRVTARIAKAKREGRGSHLLSKVHAYTKPRGNPFQIDEKAAPRYKAVK